MISPYLPSDELNLCNDYIFIDSKYNDQCFFNQVDSNTNLLDNVILRQVVMQPTKKPRSVGSHKLKSKTTMYRKETYLKTRNSGVQLHNYVEDLKNQIEMEHTYFHIIYSTQTKI